MSALKVGGKLIVASGVGILIIAIVTLFVVNNKNKFTTVSQPVQNLTKTAEFRGKTVGFSYPESAQVTTLTKKDRADNYIFRATNSATDSKKYLITIRSEAGIQKVANLTKQDVLEMLIANARKALPLRYPGFQLMGIEQAEVNSKKSAELTFTYKNNGELLRQKMLMVLRDSDTVLYVSIQAKDSEFDNLYHNNLDTVVRSLKV